MSKNILILKGSPRKNGNSARLAEAFAKGATAAGHSVDIFDAAAANLRPCKACGACWTKGKPCIFEDDFNDKLGPMLEQADVLVFATPLYWYSCSAQLKLAIDRINAFCTPKCDALGRKLKITETALLSCAAEPEESIFSGLVKTYHEIARFMQWTDRGVLTVTDTWETGALTGKPAIEQAEKMGMSL